MPVIDLATARSRLLDSRKTQTFANEIDNLREARAYGDGADVARYDPATVARLELDMIGRSLGLRDAIFQLAHLYAFLATVAPGGDPRAILLAIDGPVRWRRVARFLGEALGADTRAVQRGAEAIGLVYDDAQRFDLNVRRLPFLLALLEFALFCDAEDEERAGIDDAFERLAVAGRSRAAIAAGSNDLGTALTRFLDRVLGDRASRERLNRVAAWLDENAETDPATGRQYWIVDDEAVLALWEANAMLPAERQGMRNFRVAHLHVVELLLAFAEGEDWHAAENRAVALGDDPRAEAMIERSTVAEPGSDEDRFEGGPLARLRAEVLDRVKVLTGAEVERLRIVDGLWRLAPDLPLSALRSAVVGAHQARVTAALRSGDPVAPLLALPEADPDLYTAQIEIWDGLVGHLRDMRLAAGHGYASAHGLDLGEHAAKARTTFRRIKRKGFVETDGADVAAAFGAAIVPLGSLLALTRALLSALPDQPSRRFESDRARIEAAFRHLYSRAGDRDHADTETR